MNSAPGIRTVPGGTTVGCGPGGWAVVREELRYQTSPAMISRPATAPPTIRGIGFLFTGVWSWIARAGISLTVATAELLARLERGALLTLGSDAWLADRDGRLTTVWRGSIEPLFRAPEAIPVVSNSSMAVRNSRAL